MVPYPKSWRRGNDRAEVTKDHAGAGYFISVDSTPEILLELMVELERTEEVIFNENSQPLIIRGITGQPVKGGKELLDIVTTQLKKLGFMQE